MLPNSSMAVIRYERMLSVLIMAAAMHLGPVLDTFAQINPVSIGNATNVPGGLALGVVVSNNYAYLANGYDGLRIYDVSDPTNPTNVGHINNGGYAEIVAVSGNYAYLANRDDGLRVYDVSDPSNPLNVGHTNVTGTGLRPWAFGVTVSGNYAALANGD